MGVKFKIIGTMKTKRFFKKRIYVIIFTLFATNFSFAQIQAPSGSYICQDCYAKNLSSCVHRQTQPLNKSGSSNTISFEQQITLEIFSNIIQNASNNSKKQKGQDLQQKLLEETMQQQKLAELLAKQKKLSDSIANAKHEKMLKEQKPLEGSGNLTYKGLNDSKPAVNFNCKITSFKGKVTILKSNGKVIFLDKNSSLELAPGDRIATDYNSSVKIHYAFEKGGEDLLIGQRSLVLVDNEKDGIQIPKVEKGNLYYVNNKVTENIAETKEKISAEAEILVNQLKAKLNKNVRLRTPTAVLGVRGTEFTIHVDSLGNTQVYVFSGIVDLMGNYNDNIVSLNSGFLGIVNGKGEIIGIYKFEMNQNEKWWEEK